MTIKIHSNGKEEDFNLIYFFRFFTFYKFIYQSPSSFRYTTRWNLKGWNEEAYEARFRMARVSRHLGYSWPATQQIYLSAHSYLPKRIEPLYAIG